MLPKKGGGGREKEATSGIKVLSFYAAQAVFAWWEDQYRNKIFPELVVGSLPGTLILIKMLVKTMSSP